MVKPFQNLIRTNLNLFNVDKMSVKEVLDVLRKCTLGYFYCDVDGTFKIERPYFDTDLSSITNSIYDTWYNPTAGLRSNSMYAEADKPKAPSDYDLRYVVSRKDISFKNTNWDETEANILTRGFIQSKFDFGVIENNNASPVIKGVEGVSESSYYTIAKYGDRQITFSPINLILVIHRFWRRWLQIQNVFENKSSRFALSRVGVTVGQLLK